MTQLEFELEVPILCAGCGAGIDDDSGADRPDGLPRNTVLDADTCDNCWTNDECPDGCNTRHPAPTFRQANGAEWQCPETRTFWYYEGPNTLANRHLGNWQEYETVMVRDSSGTRYWIDADDANYCESCEHYIYAEDYAGDDMCRSCYDERSENYYDDESGSPVGEAVPVRCCGAPITHWHPVTEAVFCETCCIPGSELIPQLIAA